MATGKQDIGDLKKTEKWTDYQKLSLPAPKYYNNFYHLLGTDESNKRVCLQIGSPGAHSLRNVAEIMKISTARHFDSSNPRNEEVLQYGVSSGNWSFKQELAAFLTKNYRKPVNSEDLFVNDGVSQGLANLLYHYFQRGETVFVADPTYWNFARSFNETFRMNIVGIGMDENGFLVDKLEKQCETLKNRETCSRYPYRAAVYIVPVHQNPTGFILSEERCKRLVQLAKKYDLLVISDEVYNLLTYSAPDCNDPLLAKPPVRLFWYDKKSEPDYKGNVVSIGSVSKFLAPGLRVGWYEMPKKILESFEKHFITDSGSAWNHYTSGILAWGFHLGLVQEHVLKLRQRNRRAFSKIYAMVTDRLGKQGVICSHPSGGTFMWIALPEGYSTDVLLKRCTRELTFIPGKICSVNNSFQNCLRICVAFYDDDVLFPAMSKLCDYIESFIQGKSQ